MQFVTSRVTFNFWKWAVYNLVLRMYRYSKPVQNCSQIDLRRRPLSDSAALSSTDANMPLKIIHKQLKNVFYQKPFELLSLRSRS